MEIKKSNSTYIVTDYTKVLYTNITPYLYPAGPSPILELQNPSIDEFYVIQERRATDFKAPISEPEHQEIGTFSGVRGF